MDGDLPSEFMYNKKPKILIIVRAESIVYRLL